MSEEPETNKIPRDKGQGYLPRRAKPFTTENQPSSEAKKEGWKRRRMMMEILRLPVNKQSPQFSEWANIISKYFGIDPSEVTMEIVMHYIQIVKAVKEKDTNAYKAVFDRVFGPVKYGRDEDEKPVAAPEERQRSAIDMGNGVIIYIG